MERISLRIEPGEYEAFRQFLKNDRQFPESYVRWLNDRSVEDDSHMAYGDTVREVTVRLDQFRRYCTASGAAPDYMNLLACGAAIARHDFK